MNNVDLAVRSAEILRTCLYANIATCNENVPWNSPATAVPDGNLDFYWSSWKEAVHSHNIDANPKAFLTFFDSTRARGTNNMRCLYLRCEAIAVSDEEEARRAHELIYPGEAIELGDFFDEGLKRLYRARPLQAWLNVLSERELAPDTVKMRSEVELAEIRRAML